MSKARTLKEIEDRKSRYSRYIWAAIAAAFIGIVLGISVYIYLGLPSFFLFEKLINSLLMSSFVIAIISIVISYLSKSSVMRGEYRSAERLLPAAIALATSAAAFAASAFTPPMAKLLSYVCQTYAVSPEAAQTCLSGLYPALYGGLGAYMALELVALLLYYIAWRELGFLKAYYAPRIRRG